MNFKPKPLAAAFLLALIPAASAAPDAKAILEGARMAAALVKLDEGLSGSLRKGNTKTPVTLFLKGRDIQFQFSENKGPWRGFHMHIGDDGFNLSEIVDGKTVKFAP
jgi:hypothetical protein